MSILGGIMKKQIIDILKGMVIGIGNIAPGLSGGVFAVTLNVYDRMIAILNDFFKRPFKTVKESWGLLGGIVLGILIGFYLIIELIILLPLPTMMLFIGFIIGSIPSIYDNIKTRDKKFIDYFTFICVIIVIVALPFVGGTTHTISDSIGDLTILVLVGIIIAATLVIPGLSGSMVLIVIGFYETILMLIRDFIDACLAFDINLAFSYLIYLLPIVIGTLFGLIALSRLIARLFKTHYTTINAAILGLVIASPFSIMFTMLDSSDPDNKYFKNLQENLVLNIIVGVITLIIGAIISLKMSELEKNKKQYSEKQV